MSWRSSSAGSIAGVEFALVWKLLLKACTISETLGLEDKETMLVETGLLQDVDKYVSCDDDVWYQIQLSFLVPRIRLDELILNGSSSV